MSSKFGETRRIPGNRARKWLWYGVLAVGLSSGVVALAHEVTPPTALEEKLWSDLEATGGPRKLLMVVQVWSDGSFDVRKGANGTDEPWQDIPDPLYSGYVSWNIGNPRICYQTSGGDMQCIRYP